MRFFRRRRQGGASTAFLIFGVIGLFMGCSGILFGVPAGFIRAREVRNLPQPTAAELTNLPPGTTVILSAQIPSGAPATDGLALSYIEERLTGTPTPDNPDPSADDRDWMRIEGTESLVLVLSDGRELDTRFPTTTTFSNAQTEEIEIDGGLRDRKTVGYVPGQTLALEGNWEGNNAFTAKTVYAGTIDDFVTTVGRSPFAIFGFSLVCLLISFGLIGMAGVGRLLWR